MAPHARRRVPRGGRGDEAVVLVHGLWMHGAVFALLRRRLGRHGFVVRCFSYPSVRGGLAENAAALARFVAALDAAAIHLVGHSLGGLVILKLLAGPHDARLRRVVLMGAPCRGSSCARALLRRRGLAAIVGASLRDWGDAPAPVPRGDVDVGVLAGSRGIGFGRLVAALPHPNDGVVAEEETRLDAARDTIILPVAHAEMLVSKACAEQVAAFLRTGSFVHA